MPLSRQTIPVFRDDAANVVHETLRNHGKAAVVGSLVDMGVNIVPQP